ncbi:unnamed protein product [Soboliphyme baturini]|uniref:Secreted protein n=1 Tax=Soboliphyme baturini TaxID=241478 RepID=A0A183J0X2_9BILA|nr:unnamed protein product [Soboliphyme baturini]
MSYPPVTRFETVAAAPCLVLSSVKASTACVDLATQDSFATYVFLQCIMRDELIRLTVFDIRPQRVAMYGCFFDLRIFLNNKYKIDDMLKSIATL